MLEEVQRYNYASRPDSSIFILSNYLSQEKKDTANIIRAQIAFSNTYKSVRNYEKAISSLNSAKKFVPTNTKKTKEATELYFEMALVLFDIHQYDSAEYYMDEIRSSLMHLDSGSLAQYIMQDGYFAYQKKDYPTALEKYDECITLMRLFAERHLPMIYPKKMEVFAATEELDKLYQAMDTSLYYADKHDILVYRLYTYEMFRKSMLELKLYEEAERGRQAIKALNEKQDNQSKNNQISATEIDAKVKVINDQKRINRLLLALVIVSILALIGLAIFLRLITLNQRKIKRQKEELEKLNRINQQIISTISHDIKDPLLAIKLLLSSFKPEGKQKQLFLESAKQQVDATSNALNSLLLWSKTQLNLVKPKEDSILLRPILDEIITLNSALIQQKNIQFNVVLPEDFHFDSDRQNASIIFRNLLLNAVKYSHQNGKIDITAKENHIAVRDYGVGIPPPKLKKLFKGLVRSEYGTQMEMGSGLGLFLVQDLLRKQGYKISARNLEVGCVFEIERL